MIEALLDKDLIVSTFIFLSFFFADETLLKAVAIAFNDFSSFDQMSPIAYLLEVRMTRNIIGNLNKDDGSETMTPENNDLIGCMRKTNRAARAARTFV